jgi:hypothetical protein
VKLARSLVVLIAAALVAAPIVLDACSISCESPVGRMAVNAGATCHHPAAAGPAGIRSAPARCGHDHGDQQSVIGTRDHARDQPRPGPGGHRSAIPDCAAIDSRSGAHSPSLDIPGPQSVRTARFPLITPLRI